MPPNVTWFEVCIVYAANNAMLITMLGSDKDEPHQKHRLGTVSNNITGWGGVLNRFYGIPTLALVLVRFIHAVLEDVQSSQTMVSNPVFIPDVVQIVSEPIYFQLSHKASLDFTLAGLETHMIWKTLWFSKLTLQPNIF